MFKKIRIYLFFFPFYTFLFTLFLSACNSEENKVNDNIPPTIISTVPLEGVSNVDINSEITLQFTEPIVLASGADIKLNGVVVLATFNSQTLTITATLQTGTTYTLIIPDNAICDV